MIAFVLFIAIAGVALMDGIYRLLFPPETFVRVYPVWAVQTERPSRGCGAVALLAFLFVGVLALEFWL